MRLLIGLFLLSALIVKSSVAEETATFSLNDDVTLKLVKDEFVVGQHSVLRCDNEETGQKDVCLINGRPVFGSAGEVPESYLKEASLEIEGKVVNLDVTCMYDPWYEKPEAEFFILEESDHGLILRGEFSDGDGAYYAEWLIVGYASVRISIFYKQC